MKNNMREERERLINFLPLKGGGGGVFERGGLLEDLRYSAEGVGPNLVTFWRIKDVVCVTSTIA